MVLEILNKKLCVAHLLDAATIECLADELSRLPKASGRGGDWEFWLDSLYILSLYQ